MSCLTRNCTKKLIIVGAIVSFILAGKVIGQIYYKGLLGVYPQFVKSSFEELPNWKQDDLKPAFYAFKKSCAAIAKMNPAIAFHNLPQYGKAKDWQLICAAANKVTIEAVSLRTFFESSFQPYHVINHLNPNGLFTGYYLPQLEGHLKPSKKFNVPIYGLPDDLVKINLANFGVKLKNVLVGQVKDHQLYPYPDRRIIQQAGLYKNAPVLVWGNNPIDVFFAQIQGSTIVKLTEHQQMVLGYAGGNGQPYTAIGKVLVARHLIKKENISMQSIRAWLSSHPDKIDEILNQNASYVFFKLLKNSEPIGAQQVPLTAERSLAVDTQYVALGTPIWLDTAIVDVDRKKQLYQHLLIAQDTGGDIRGVVRGDVYWGSGERAAVIAGHMASRGQYWILLPR